MWTLRSSSRSRDGRSSLKLDEGHDVRSVLADLLDVIGESASRCNTMRKRESYLPSAERVQERVAALYSRVMGENAMSQSHSPLENLKTTFGVSLDSSGRPDFTAAAHEAAVKLSSANAREGV